MKKNYDNGYYSLKNTTIIGLKGYLLRTYTYLVSKDYKQKGVFYSQERIAKDLGVTTRTIQRHMKELKELGYISIKRRGLGMTNLYTLLVGIVAKNKEKAKDKAKSFAQKFIGNKKPNYFVEHCPERDRSEGNESGYMTLDEIEKGLLGWT